MATRWRRPDPRRGRGRCVPPLHRPGSGVRAVAGRLPARVVGERRRARRRRCRSAEPGPDLPRRPPHGRGDGVGAQPRQRRDGHLAVVVARLGPAALAGARRRGRGALCADRRPRLRPRPPTSTVATAIAASRPPAATSSRCRRRARSRPRPSSGSSRRASSRRRRGIPVDRPLPADLYPDGAVVTPVGWVDEDHVVAVIDPPPSDVVERPRLAVFTSPDVPESEWTYREFLPAAPVRADQLRRRPGPRPHRRPRPGAHPRLQRRRPLTLRGRQQSRPADRRRGAGVARRPRLHPDDAEARLEFLPSVPPGAAHACVVRREGGTVTTSRREPASTSSSPPAARRCRGRRTS